MEKITNSSRRINRPGGFSITNRAIGFCSLKAGSKVLDLGCGSGATVEHLRHHYRFEAYGIDKISLPADAPSGLITASAEEIPFPPSTFDGVFMECSLSVMDDPTSVLTESYRVLKSDGRLIISDLYARGEPAHLKGCLGRLDTKNDLLALMEENGFTTDLFEDYSHDLQTLWGQMIFEQGAESFYSDLGTDPETLKRIKCGYCLIIADKKEQGV